MGLTHGSRMRLSESGFRMTSHNMYAPAKYPMTSMVESILRYACPVFLFFRFVRLAVVFFSRVR